MMRVIVASKNPIKVDATKKAFADMFSGNEAFEFVSISVSSDVADQPMTDDETHLGAQNRVNNAKKTVPDADFWVGLEGGLEEKDGEMHAFGWMAIATNHRINTSRTATFVLPPAVSKLIRQGMELGEADDIVFKMSNSKQQSGAIGLLTNNLITRESYYQQALMMALIPFTQPDLYE